MEKILNLKKYTYMSDVSDTVTSKLFFFCISASLVLLFISITVVYLEYFQLNFTRPKDARERERILKKKTKNSWSPKITTLTIKI